MFIQIRYKTRERQRKNGLLVLKSAFEILTHLYLNNITNGASGKYVSILTTKQASIITEFSKSVIN